MTLASTLRQKLADGPFATARHDFLVQEGPWALTLTADRRDDLSSLIWELRLDGSQPAAKNPQTWAEHIAANATGLMEPVELQEIDDAKGQILLRSSPLTVADGLRSYFEIFVHGTTGLTMRRYRVAEEAAAKREQIAFALTNESLVKLVRDMVPAGM